MFDGWENRGGWGRVPGYSPPGPHNLPRGAAARWGTAGAGVPPGIDVREVNRYPMVTTVAINVGLTGQLLVSQPDTTRIVLIVRCDASSAGSILVAFGISASINTAAFTIPPGGVLLLDYVVPQDDVFIVGSAAGCVGTCVYANSAL